jgi:excisionase family DNA binding protein
MSVTMLVELPDDVLTALEARVAARVKAELAQREAAPAWLSDKTAAVYASTSESTIARWRTRGLPFHIIGGLVRVKATELDRWLLTHPQSCKR